MEVKRQVTKGRGIFPPCPLFCWYIKKGIEMKGRAIIGSILACLVLTIAVGVKTAIAQGQSPSSHSEKNHYDCD